MNPVKEIRESKDLSINEFAKKIRSNHTVNSLHEFAVN